jgi:hypothetical protein
MKALNLCHQVWKCVAVSAVLVLATFARGSEHAVKSDLAVPKSVFVDDVQNGKDPFYPNSTRRAEALPRVATTTNSAPASSLLFDQLFLKGISGTKGEPLAIINTATIGLGEVAEIRCSGQVLKVRCREIRERSVLIELVGSHEVKELKLRDNI